MTRDGADIVRDAGQRCVSTDEQKPGRTHACRLIKTHEGEHRYICSRSWKRGEKAGA